MPTAKPSTDCIGYGGRALSLKASGGRGGPLQQRRVLGENQANPPHHICTRTYAQARHAASKAEAAARVECLAAVQCTAAACAVQCAPQPKSAVAAVRRKQSKLTYCTTKAESAEGRLAVKVRTGGLLEPVRLRDEVHKPSARHHSRRHIGVKWRVLVRQRRHGLRAVKSRR